MTLQRRIRGGELALGSSLVDHAYAIAGPLALSRSTVDRAAHLRDNEEWMATAWADPATKVLLVGNGRVSTRGDILRFVSPGEAPDGEAYLLGVENGEAFAAVHVSELDGADTGSLREVGVVLGDRDAGLAVHAIALANWHATHRFCPRCGQPTVVACGGHIRRCVADGSEHYPRVDPAVIMLVIDEYDRCLLGRQQNWPGRRYSTLAGFVEPGETPEHAVVREVAEEVGITVNACRYAGAQPWPFPSSLMLGYYADARATEPTPDGEEIQDAQWFSRAELAAAVSGGEIEVPSPISIAHRLLEGWYGAPLEQMTS
ncbi:NAD(+) diphosphatase [Phytoactinopolyspora alkaliphila]|uniref:NAD(+) diphosphatase n=1 Tax=Phytoactinopolyspora alkaliphila TaxID=1783498 RepID=A0A6N9YQH0_9ACTN|nr:NAD(+) diphosphatase [Phytoactinopolyspora alkaliphila]NED97197.1 NAD(+) diphosphatase [Phytoactinopolyspora alkaliphila]